MNKNFLIPIREIPKKYNISYSTVNYYTIIGLLTVVTKRCNMRLYNEAEVKESLKRISKLKDKGYPLHLIKKELLK
jgi:DNA-binding transcriptional MerR regulator